MAANGTLSLTALDFDTLKSNFITFLQSQSQFKDYNFSGSNINVLLDILSYNSYLNTFYLNMVASEMFLDSAQLLNSVVSHAKELNYFPASTASSSANISFSLATTGAGSPFVVPQGTAFNGINSNGTYTFTTAATTYYTSANVVGNTVTYNINNLLVYEGAYVTDTFIVDYTVEGQQFILSNPNIDTRSLVVNVFESANNPVTYTQATTLFGLNSNSQVYFVQAAQDGKYEILFGDNLFGHIPLNSSLITASYRTSSGEAADGVSTFSLTYNLGAYNGGAASVVGNINTITSSTGGASAESADSIKFRAPRYFATQQRGVSSDDYSSLVLTNFGNDIGDVTVYGGELLTPKQYGFVAVCLKPTNSTVAPNYIKNQISNYLESYAGVPTRVIITDPDYFYCTVNSSVSYSTSTTDLSSSDIQNEVLNAMLNYSSNSLSTFNSNFRFSKFATAIDNADSSIISNDTQVLLTKRVSPTLNTPNSFTINYNNAIAQDVSYAYQSAAIPAGLNDPTFWSSPFTYVDTNNISYINAIIRDDGYGNLLVYTNTSGIITQLTTSVGTINYKTGLVQINGVTFGSFIGSYINFYVTTNVTDIMINRNQILLIDPVDVTITVTPVAN